METVVVLGASANPDRYSFRAIESLLKAGHQVIPVHPALDTIQDIPVVPSLADITASVDTVTVYVNPTRLGSLTDQLVELKPKRVILNPGAESDESERILREAGIHVQLACTLVMLATGQW